LYIRRITTVKVGGRHKVRCTMRRTVRHITRRAAIGAEFGALFSEKYT